MKNAFFDTSAFFLMAAILLFLPGDGGAQVLATNASEPRRQLLNMSATGAPTNGLRAEIFMEWPEGQMKLAETTVYVLGVPGWTNDNISLTNKSDKDWLIEYMVKLANSDWLYYKPTNAFCGPIELVDAGARKCELLTPEVSLAESYPDSYSFALANGAYIWRHPYSGGAYDFPTPIVEPLSKTAQFRIADYFAITNAGAYRLTVWPKIYKRSSTNKDLCERIDLPPVTITFQWLSEPQK